MAERKMPSVEDYPSNANGSKPIKTEDRVVDPVKMRGKAKTKRSFLKDVRGEFVSEDAPNIGNYILYDILLPALRDMVSDIGHGALDMAMGTDTRRYSNSRRRDRNSSYVSYNRYWDDRDYDRRKHRDRDDDRYERRGRDIDDIIFDYREDAEDCLDRMCDYLERYESVPVSYLFDICGMTVPGDFTKDDWGWYNLSSAKVRHVRGGYIIDLPKVRPI